jgi:transposase
MCQREYQRELKRVQLPTIWTIPDKMWQRIRPLLPPEKQPGAPGRPPLPFRKVMNGILFVLRTGCQWKALPGCYGSGSIAHRRFQQWVGRGIIDAIVRVMVEWYERWRGIDWEWQAADTKLLLRLRLGVKRRDLTPPTWANRGPSDICWSMDEVFCSRFI